MYSFKQTLYETKLFFRDRLKKTFVACFVIYLIIIARSAAYVIVSGQSRRILESITDVFNSLDVMSAGEDGTMTINVFRLAFQNIRAAALAVILGFLPFLYIPGFLMFMNAAIVGLLIGAMQGMGISMLGTIVCTILPHGIFELPANVLGDACGIYLCTSVIRFLLKKRDRVETREEIIGCIRVYLYIVIPLLLIAAPIESFVTPWIADKFLYLF